MYPEHEKLQAIKDQSQVCGAFLEWLLRRYSFCTLNPVDAYFYPTHIDVNSELAAYFDIDRNKIEDEKRAMLAELRRMNAER